MRTLSTTIGGRMHLRSGWLWAFAIALLIVAGAGAAAVLGGHGGLALAFALTAFAIYVVPYAAFLTTSAARDLGGWLRHGGTGLLPVFYTLFGAYLLYAIGTQSFALASAMRLSLFIGLPMALLWTVKRRTDVAWQDFAAVFCIWLPFDAGWLKSIWTWPAGGGAYIFNTVLAVNLAVALFVGYRGLAGVTPRLRLTLADLRLAGLALVGFMALALPIGFATGFVTWNPQLTPLKLIGTPLGIFFFIALPEELLFRGLVQNLLTRRFGRPTMALLVTAVLFGATHLNNGPTPDVRYFALATVAGVFYGVVYRRTHGLAAPALLHAAVDTLWVWFFHT